MNRPLLPILNLVILLFTIFWNYYANTGIFNGETMGSLSNAYDTLFTPAGYAFSIWGIIYIGLLGNAIYAIRYQKEPGIWIQSMWLSLANIGNCIWIYAWLNDYTALSVITMVFILICLTRNMIDLKIGQEKRALWIWWPVTIYFGWIIVALVANISAYLVKIGWQSPLKNDMTAALLILIATGIYLWLSLKKNIVYAAYVGVWAFIAILVKQWDQNTLIEYTALISAVILFALNSSKDYVTRKSGLY